MYIQEIRAVKVLYNFLKANQFAKPFLIPSNVCAILPLTFLKANVNFEFVDISTDNYCIDQNIVFQLLKKEPEKYNGILFVRSYGIDDSFQDFFKQIKAINQNIVTIDDACLCKPNINDSLDDSVDLKLYSTGYSKYVDVGFGGFAFLNNNLAYQSFSEGYQQEDYDFMINEIKKSEKEAILFDYDPSKNWMINEKLPLSYIDLVKKKLPIASQHKEKINLIYKENLPSKIILNDKFQNWRFNILVEKQFQEVILSNLFKNKLFASTHYSSLSNIFRQKVSQNSDNIRRIIINLFNDFYYTEEQALLTCKVINQTL